MKQKKTAHRVITFLSNKIKLIKAKMEVARLKQY